MTSTQTTRPAVTAPAIALTGLHKSYGDVHAVRGLDLEIEAGRIVALLGPNGAGKSTTLSMVLGLLPPDRGRVSVLGLDPHRAIRQGRIAAMPQDGGLVARVTVAELLRFVRGTSVHPLPMAELLATAQLEDLAGRRADGLSGGQAQRVRLAMAMAGAPDVLVLDEPTAALDVLSRRALWASLRAYAARGRTVVFSTHYLEEADENADRVVVVARGTVVADGTPEEVKRSVTHRTVAVDAAACPPDRWASLPGVTRVEVRGARALLRCNDADAAVTALAGLGAVRGIEVSGANLDDAFLSLTAADAPPS